MKVLVCVKRVPMTGGRIVLTDDEQAIETKHLGFAISPHEECGVEEAVRLVEQHGGESVVLTLGPAEAEEQLRDAMAIGIDRGTPPRHRTARSGIPRRRRARSSRRSRADEAASGPFDLIFFGNESADSGGFQVGLRVAYALGRPCATGLKAVAVDGGSVRCEQEVGGGRDVYELPLPAVVTVLEGLNLPRYPSVPGRMRAGRKPLEASHAGAARVAARAARGSSSRRVRRSRPRCSATAPTPRPPSSTCSSRSGWRREPRPRRARRRRADRGLAAGARARGGARRRGRRAPDRHGCRGGGSGACPSPSRTSRSTRRSTSSRPMPGRRSSAASSSGSGPTAVVAPGTPRGDRRAWRARPCGWASRSRRT